MYQHEKETKTNKLKNNMNEKKGHRTEEQLKTKRNQSQCINILRAKILQHEIRTTWHRS
jgi:hypothetical protein